MKIRNIRLQNFKKFSNLTIDNLPDKVKLVVLLGPNGCGKSSLIESMEVARKIYGLHQIPWGDSNFNYYIKRDRAIRKVYHQTRANLQAREDILVETQLSQLNFRRSYIIRNLANPSEVSLQPVGQVPQVTLDLVRRLVLIVFVPSLCYPISQQTKGDIRMDLQFTLQRYALQLKNQRHLPPFFFQGL